MPTYLHPFNNMNILGKNGTPHGAVGGAHVIKFWLLPEARYNKAQFARWFYPARQALR